MGAPPCSNEVESSGDDADFATKVIGAELPVLVEFTADWCPPCRLGAPPAHGGPPARAKPRVGEEPVLSALAAEQGGRLKVVQLNVDANPATTHAYKVLSMPTFMVFRDGEPLRSMVGARPKRRLLEELGEVI
ncbi:thioredoxin domain-containing protein [Streptomyces hirsutus]|uniref:thioredoxin family protein n=1 Tax=Streptomyces hirsutus TaxID=35620 RepID=UPI00386DABD0|nr:thioredoxin domain-containing protein [Streptomyces hirsutus]